MYHDTECGWEQHGHEGSPGIGHGMKWGHHGYCGWGRTHHGGGCCCGCHHGGGMHHGSHFGLFGHRRFISKEEIIAGERDINDIIKTMEKEMKKAAKNLEFEKAARLRDKITALRSRLP